MILSKGIEGDAVSDIATAGEGVVVDATAKSAFTMSTIFMSFVGIVKLFLRVVRTELSSWRAFLSMRGRKVDSDDGLTNGLDPVLAPR